MLDYLNWYLVELEQRLRGKRSAESAADFILETRSHLEERVDDLVGKGVDRVTAARAAVADFGDPDSVVQAYSGARPMSKKAAWGWIIAAGVMIGSIGGGLGSLLLSVPVVIPALFRIIVFLPLLGFLITALLAYRTRAWVGVGIGCVAIAFSLVGASYATSNAEFLRLPGRELAVTRSQIGKDIAAREQWLSAFDKDFAEIQAWRAARAAKDPKADAMLMKLSHRDTYGSMAYVGPNRNYWGPRPMMDSLPSTINMAISGARFYIDSPMQQVTLSGWGDFKYARDMWNQNGDIFVASLKEQRQIAEMELAALRDIQPSPWWTRFAAVGLPIMAAVATAAVLGLALNGIVSGLISVKRKLRRAAWRRLIG